jgi:hypothetical protein
MNGITLNQRLVALVAASDGSLSHLGSVLRASWPSPNAFRECRHSRAPRHPCERFRGDEYPAMIIERSFSVEGLTRHVFD